MSEKKDGGPAFPYIRTQNEEGYLTEVENFPGMTLRDYLAAKVIQGLCANSQIEAALQKIENNGNFIDPKKEIKAFVEVAYEMADAMLEEREK
jgi:hypothetical protein